MIYDSRSHGYNGIFSSDPNEKEYDPHFKQKKRRGGLPAELCISVEHTQSYEEFQKANPCDLIRYSNAFTWIVIYSVDANNKKRKLFEFETD